MLQRTFFLYIFVIKERALFVQIKYDNLVIRL